jgi:hypothetical protein
MWHNVFARFELQAEPDPKLSFLDAAREALEVELEARSVEVELVEGPELEVTATTSLEGRSIYARLEDIKIDDGDGGDAHLILVEVE